MAAAPLTSNHVNYLIWRYLQESGHDRTAARLQRDWKIGDPETLPFAPHIKTHALVSLVQKGLQFHELENSLQQNGERHNQAPTTLFFGTGPLEAAKTEDDAAASNLKAPASPNKRSRDSTSIGHAKDASAPGPSTKRRRGGAGKDVSQAASATSGDEMDVDPPVTSQDSTTQNDYQRRLISGSPNGVLDDARGAATGVTGTTAVAAADASHARPPTFATLEIGRSVPTQTDAITQIGSTSTRLLELGAGRRTLKTVWNPQQPNLLASAGDKLCRIWSVPSGSSSGSGSAAQAQAGSPPNATDASATSAPQHYDLFEGLGQGMDRATITAIAWTPDGDYLAAARTPDDLTEASAISVFDKHGAEITQLGRGQRFFFGLAFNPAGTLLLGFGADNQHYEDGTREDGEKIRDYGLCVWDVAGDIQGIAAATTTAYRQDVEAAAWLDDSNVLVCGPGYIATTSYSNGALSDLEELTLDITQADGSAGADTSGQIWHWTFIEHDRYTKACILADEFRGVLALLNADRTKLVTIQAHDAEIRGIQFQPLPQHGSSGDGPRLVASASLDGSVKIWNVAKGKIELVRTLHCNSVDPSQQPALAMQFSPDGGTLAVATTSKVWLWRPETLGAWPHAEWTLERDVVGWRDGSPFVKSENALDPTANGIHGSAANGHNGHGLSNGINGTVSSGTDAPVNEADRTGAERNGPRFDADSEEPSPTPTIAWSAMGKKLAYGSGEQIAIADTITVGSA